MAKGYLDAMDLIARRNVQKISITAEKSIIKAYYKAGNELVNKFRRTRVGSATRAYYASYIRSLATDMRNIVEKAGLDSATIPAEMQKLMLEESFKEAGITSMTAQEFNKVFGSVPRDSMARIIEGNIYKDTTTLSDRIWGRAIQSGNDIQGVITSGLAQQTSASKMAKILEEYVDPSARKLWTNDKIKEKLGDGYAKWNNNLEYNSLRLARTTITHSFQLSHNESCKRNPFVDEVQWHSVLAHGRTCALCRERHLKIFKADEVPLDHPNGLCYQSAVVTKSLDDIADELKDWAKGGSNKKLDKWEKTYLK